MDSLINILYLVRNLIVGIARLMYLLEQMQLTLQKLFPRRKTQASYQPTPPCPRSGQKWSSSYLNDPKNRKLQQDLIAMLRGDIGTAKRLLRHERQRHPGKSDNWYLEKVIGDLERDRR